MRGWSLVTTACKGEERPSGLAEGNVVSGYGGNRLLLARFGFITKQAAIHNNDQQTSVKKVGSRRLWTASSSSSFMAALLLQEPNHYGSLGRGVGTSATPISTKCD
jgi:hypothetical protein